ncbi:helix-turn-helix transcriptional regulator [Candidatus Woesearchaeota archaeon]|nr:helix-turn-helix transcriptional regulator [Candidatus Woesearchaeota archaeon]
MATTKEEQVILALFKHPENELSASGLAKLAGLSRMHALRMLKRLEKDGAVTSRKVGKSVIYTIDLSEGYARNLLRFLLTREAKKADPYVRRWLTELKGLKHAKAAILFGSVLQKGKDAKDIDVVLITDQRNLQPLDKEVDALNRINAKPLHPLYQASKDFRRNIRKKDPVILNALKGIIAFGEDEVMAAYDTSGE